MNLALAQMDSFQNWFFWTWKVRYILSFALSLFDITSKTTLGGQLKLRHCRISSLVVSTRPTEWMDAPRPSGCHWHVQFTRREREFVRWYLPAMADRWRGRRLHRTLRYRTIPLATFNNKCRPNSEFVTYVYPHRHHPDPAPAVIDADTNDKCECG